jgi:hypothetical protein
MAMGKLVFAQIMEHLPLMTFHRCVARYGGEHKVKRFLASISISAWRSRSLPTAKACATSKLALEHKRASSITWASAVAQTMLKLRTVLSIDP